MTLNKINNDKSKIRNCYDVEFPSGVRSLLVE